MPVKKSANAKKGTSVKRASKPATTKADPPKSTRGVKARTARPKKVKLKKSAKVEKAVPQQSPTMITKSGRGLNARSTVKSVALTEQLYKGFCKTDDCDYEIYETSLEAVREKNRQHRIDEPNHTPQWTTTQG
ncbi:MAG: hypothetical protein EOO88_08915 [Pedobacter sp.]|nr:MAG: hypothetical protein EOO88_08915 [Pedobacter sp.]